MTLQRDRENQITPGMKVKITGSSGYLGTLITKKLQNHGYKVSGIPRKLLYGPTEKLSSVLHDSHIVINLAGSPILTRWTKKNKKVIYESRVKTTQNLVNAINKLPVENQIQKIISASAIGIYTSGKKHDETSTEFNTDFLGKVVRDWEKSLNGLPPRIPKIIFRMAPVLGKNSETVKQMWLPFKMGIGGTIGNGKQPFPFIHEEDIARAYLWAIENYMQSGLFNLSAPDSVTNKEFTRAFSKRLHRPALLKVPGLVLKLLYGEAAETLLDSPVAEPRLLQEAGYQFKFPDIDSVLNNILP